MTKASRASCVRSSSMCVSGVFKGAVNIPNFGSYLLILKKDIQINYSILERFICDFGKNYLSISYFEVNLDKFRDSVVVDVKR